MSADLERNLRQVNTLLRDLLKREQKETWVSAIAIMKLTGWDSAFMRTARKDNIVQSRKAGKGYQYLIESIPSVLLLKQAS